MILEKGDMWTVYDQSDLFCVTTNSSLLTDGDLIMGAGIAREAREKFPYLPNYLGLQIAGSYSRQDINKAIFSIYGLVVYGKIGAFQTKTNWRAPARLDIILRSTAALLKWIEEHPEVKRIDLNFPGIGLGQLPRQAVLPIISVLPNIVHVWEQE